jgi:eukaryotic-like serine/threonine-protein kinase
MILSPDVTIADRFTLEHRIAVGGMGEVWRAQDTLLSRRVAVKVLKPEYAADPSFLRRFRDEARHTAGLSHPGVASVFDYGELGDMAYLVMECVDGEPLSAMLAREGRLSVERSLDIVGQAGLALQAAHDLGVVHRDVKPANLLVRPDGVVKVTDFGIARVAGAAGITQTGFVVGTAAYLSPEQAAGRPTTPASDLYALGLVAYECLAGHRAFDAESAVATALAQINDPPPPLPPDVPGEVAAFVFRALDKDPKRRQPSAGDFGRTALALAAPTPPPPAGEAGSATAVTAVTNPVQPANPANPATKVLTSPVPPPRRRSIDPRQRKARAAFIAVGAAVVLAGFGLLWALGTGPREVTVPPLAHERYATAAGALRTLGLGVTRRDTHSALDAGTVVSQQPAAGSRLTAGSTVVLVVSDGPPTVPVDLSTFYGQRAADAQATLTAEQLQVRTVNAPSDQPPGTVIGVSPTGNLPVGSTVTLTVSAPAPGPGPGGKGHDHGDGGNGGN